MSKLSPPAHLVRRECTVFTGVCPFTGGYSDHTHSQGGLWGSGPRGYQGPQLGGGYSVPQQGGYSVPQRGGTQSLSWGGYSVPQQGGIQSLSWGGGGYSVPQPGGYSVPQLGGTQSHSGGGYSVLSQGEYSAWVPRPWYKSG